MTRTTEDRNVVEIVIRELRAAPLRLRIFMAVTVVYIVAMLAWSVEKRGWESILSLQTTGAWLGALSAIMIGYSFSLFTMAQEGRACTGAFRIRLRTYRMHPMLLALPVLCFMGGLLSVVSLSIFIGRLSGAALLAVGVPTAMVLWFAFHGVRVTTRFLYDHAREQAELAATAREEATRSQLAALQAQLNPHFLFNSLNTVAALVRTDARRAEATVENLAHILRRTLDRSARTTIPLSDELDYLRAYLSIEQERFGARLAVDWQVDPAALGCPVPPMTLQPLVENSLKHGLSKKLEGGRVRIIAVRRNGSLQLQVEDDGPGFGRDARDGTGMGNLRQRLATLYGGSATFHVNGGHGASVTLAIPVEPPA